MSAVDAVGGRAVADVLETEEARGLLEAAQQAGSVNADEIALALDELDLDASQIEDFYHALEELHIEVVAPDAEPVSVSVIGARIVSNSETMTSPMPRPTTSSAGASCRLLIVCALSIVAISSR